jgi:superfamily II DNA or RNA helicase
MATLESLPYWIKTLDPVESLMSPALSAIVESGLSYKGVYWRQGPFHKIRKDYTKSTIIKKSRDGHLFYTGLIPRVVDIAKKKGVVTDYITDPNMFDCPIVADFHLPDGLKHRSFGVDLLLNAVKAKRGVLKAPTGTGKTFIGLSLIYSIKNLEGGVLWLVHTKDLLSQTAKEAEVFFGKQNIGKIGDGLCQDDKFLTIATRQSFIDLAGKLGTAYDMVIVDEVHHISTFSGDYAKILSQIMAPIRIGLTATLRTDQEGLLAMEAFIGPVIGEYTINEGREDGYMANPKIIITKLTKKRLTKTTENDKTEDCRTYSDVYEYGVVRNLERNVIISNLISEYEKIGKTCLVVVNKIAHGQLLQNICRNKKVEAEFVCGSTDTESRDLAKKYLNEKNLKCVICTAVWKEGVNIPELDVVINAAGGKSELNTLQAVGRGLRRTKTKEELIIHDFFDPSHHYLVDHFGYRISLYMENKWM